MSLHTEVILLVSGDFPNNLDEHLNTFSELSFWNEIKSVPIIPENSAIFDWVSKGFTGQLSRKEGTRLLSHIHALRKYIYESTADSLFIIEDSVTYTSEFESMVSKILSDLQNPEYKHYDFVSFGLNTSGNRGNLEANFNNSNYDRYTLYRNGPESNGLSAYWMRRSYAHRCLEILDRPFYLYPEVNSSLLFRYGTGLLIEPPLVHDEYPSKRHF